MNHTTVILSFVFFLTSTLPALSKELQVSSTKGEAVYRAHCVECHGLYGKGGGPEAAH